MDPEGAGSGTDQFRKPLELLFQLPHFTAGETEAQRGGGTGSVEVSEVGFKPSLTLKPVLVWVFQEAGAKPALDVREGQ